MTVPMKPHNKKKEISKIELKDFFNYKYHCRITRQAIKDKMNWSNRRYEKVNDQASMIFGRGFKSLT